jgi:hypothetical protein
MKKITSLLFLFLLSLILSAQSTDKIKVKKLKWDVSITSADSVFWIRKANQVMINVKGGTNYAINIQGGTISKKAGNYIVHVKEEGAATISVYEKLPDKKLRVLYTKMFPVKRIPSPQMYVCGVRADSVIDRQQIISDNIVTAYHPFYKTNLPVVGFDVIFSGAGKMDKLSSPNNRFTLEMKKRIHSLKSGTLLYFENVYYLMPDGSKEKIEAFEVYVSETNKYKVGYRVWGL